MKKLILPLLITSLLILVLLLPLGSASAELSTLWKPLNSTTANYINQIFFLDPLEGWASAPNATLLHTTDGGVNWSTITTGASTSKGFHTVRFLDHNTGWVGGNQVIARTENGGVNWTILEYTGSITYRNAYFPVSSTVAWGVGGTTSMRTHYRYTFSGGSITEEYWSVTDYSRLMNDINMVDADNGWSIGSGGLILRITDGTSPTSPTFSGQTSGTGETLNSIQMLDLNNGYIVGANGVILKTTNGGGQWDTLTSGTTTNLRGLAFFDVNHGIVVGDGGLILSTSNAGATWQPEYSGVAANLTGAFMTSAYRAYAGGQSGTLLMRSAAGFIPLIVKP